jgi:hypothetical protein
MKIEVCISSQQDGLQQTAKWITGEYKNDELGLRQLQQTTKFNYKPPYMLLV